MGIVKKIIPNSLYQKLRIIKYKILQNLMKVFWIFPIANNKVVFSNFNGKGYGCNPKYIAEKMMENERYKLYWLLQDMSQSLPSSIKKIKHGSLLSIYHLATAQIWVDNNRKEPYISKRKGQFYLQTWHGSIALKKIEKDATDSLDMLYVYNAKKDSAQIDAMISNSRFSYNLFRDSFWYEGEIYKCGTPRLDILFEDVSNKIRNHLNVGETEIIVLYAPTFRNSKTVGVYQFDFNKLLNAVRLKYHKKVKLLLRLHPHLSSERIFSCELSKDIIDVTTYPDVYEILAASDILITDYSSLMFEFPINEHKPVFIYAPDLEEYDRGLYFRFSDLPFALAKTEDELIRNISQFDCSIYTEKVLSFYRDAEIYEKGDAAKKVTELLAQIIS